MTFINALHMLLGAGLVAFGVLAHAAAQRMLRGPALPLPAPRWQSPEASPTITRVRAARPAGVRQVVPVIPVAPAPVVPEVLPRTAKPPAAARPADDAMANDVISALTSAGYRKATVAAAVAACESAERASIESWTRAALRRCARGVA